MHASGLIAQARLSSNSARESVRTGNRSLVRLIRDRLNLKKVYGGNVQTKRTPDLLAPGLWAMEFRIARSFGDNDAEAENWSVNLLHPYPGNVSVIGDGIKLVAHEGCERRAAIVIGFEHVPARISLTPLFDAFEAVARGVMRLPITSRVEEDRDDWVHPVHQRQRVAAWEVLNPEGRRTPNCS